MVEVSFCEKGTLVITDEEKQKNSEGYNSNLKRSYGDVTTENRNRKSK